jgi:hypothetical protein
MGTNVLRSAIFLMGGKRCNMEEGEGGERKMKVRHRKKMLAGYTKR